MAFLIIKPQYKIIIYYSSIGNIINIITGKEIAFEFRINIGCNGKCDQVMKHLPEDRLRTGAEEQKAMGRSNSGLSVSKGGL